MGLQTLKYIALRKSKKRNEKLGKLKLPTKDISSIINSDLANLRKPIDTNVSALYEVSKLLETGTEEVKSILSHECNVIYECRTCRSLFRSIVNLISHKKEYCRIKYISLEKSLSNNSNVMIEDTVAEDDRILRSQVIKEYPEKKDCSIVDMLNKKQEENVESNFFSNFSETKIENNLANAANKQHVYLESIDTNCSAVYQSIKSPNTVIETTDLMKAEIIELQNIDRMIDEHIITLEGQVSENQSEKSDSPIQMDMSEENECLLMPRSLANNLVCHICRMRFSTKKTLNVHMKTLHTAQRMCYVCPCCTNTFANTWGVYRHLSKVHKKTHEQVRKLRSLVQGKVLQKETSVTKNSGNTRAAKTSTLRHVTMTNNNKYQDYNRHRKRTHRKISAHSQCQNVNQMPITCNESTTNMKHSDKALSDVIPTDTNDRPMCEIGNIDTTTDCNISAKAFSKKNMLNAISTSNKDDFMSPVTQNADENKLLSVLPHESPNHYVSDKKVSNILPVKMRYKKRRWLNCHGEKLSIDLKQKDMEKDQVQEMDNSRLQSSPFLDEKDETSLMENKIDTMADFLKMQCLRCKRKFTSVAKLRKHIATHVGWNRYRCKLCDFKCFAKCDCVAHCKKVHDAQNDRMMITELVIEISHNEHTCNESIITNIVTNTSEKLDDPDVMDIVSSNQLETSLDLNNSSNSSVHIENTVISEQASVTESHEDKVEHKDKNVDRKNYGNGEITTMENLSDYMMNYDVGKLDSNPDLKRIVMQVILGPNDTTETPQGQTESDNKTTLTTDSNMRDYTKNDENNTAFIAESEKNSYSSTNNLKRQRPMRNRIKRLHADYIYDLKKITFRKESALPS